jgi:quaternary ammonium compound-resistance protein SugE
MGWTLLFVAGLLEIAWAVGLKYAEGFSRLWPTVFTVTAMVGSFYCLAQAIRTIPLGTAYAVWTGIGAFGTALVGIALFAESASPARLACLLVIVIGIAGLKITA